MNDSFFSGVSTKARLAFWGMTAGAIAVPMALVIIFGRPEPIARNLVFGCYKAPNSPTLIIQDDTIRIIEPQKRTLDYVVEPSKMSYQLNVKPALQLTPQIDGRYAYIQTRGIGFFWPLLPTPGRNRDRVRHPDEYAGRFRMSATDGTEVTYTRVGGTVCS